ncbi:hypothetical protein [Chryseobacterium oryctis]|uniref:Beta-carotene 15,15'-monooxygenase n=1 Tax=Chryseobacterium oryctis TaxID=2952618 RepID=A0ABT3HLZ1_9FLAO|nr:hypothetical protein [Chryseobacterium oryctis]MCW3160797.1 hypothetical protein [Chryseobacterium oryctis]
MQNKYPQKPGIDFILKQAFFYWNKTLVFQLMFSIIYFAIFFTSFFFLDSRFGILEMRYEVAEAFKTGTNEYLEKVAEISSTENYQKFLYGIMGTLIFLYPLNLGFFQIFRKIDLKEKIVLGDLFAGYNGFNFFKYIGYYIFWFFTYLMVTQTIILPIIWVFVTLFVAPLMFFTNKRIFEAISINFKVLKMYFIEIAVCVMVAFFFKYIGFALFLIGGLFTFPFWNAMIYSLYTTIFTEKN